MKENTEEFAKLKEEFIYGINRFRKWNVNKDNRLQKYSDQERFILLYMYSRLEKGDESVSAKDIMKRLTIGKEVLSRTMRKLISAKAVLRKVDAVNKRCVNYSLTKTTISDCIIIQASIDSEIEALIHILGEEDSRNLIRILTKASNALDLQDYLEEAED